MTAVLRGPADADHYRVKVGRYGDRWYTDPLPTCPIAEASDWQGPSWSIVKGAAGKDWSFVTNKRNGHTAAERLHHIADLEPAERVSAFNAINKHGLEQAGGRGTIVHWWAEDLLAGRTPRDVTDPMLFTARLPKAALVEAYDYLPALHAFFDHYQPEVIAAEYVAIHRDLNGVGYGCTPDVIALVQGQLCGIDWKTRGADSDHGAYPEEAAQIAAGARAQYIIIEGPDGAPRRSQVPHIDCGIVVSIKPDGCRVYPVDIDHGAAHLQAMHAFWVARLTEKAAIGKPWAPTPISDGLHASSDATGTVGILQSPGSVPVAPTNQETPWTSTSSKQPKPSQSFEQTSTKSSATKTPTTASGTTPGTKKAPSSATTTTGTPTQTTTPSTTTPNPSSSDDPDEFALTAKILANAMLTWPEELRTYLKDWWPTDTPTPGAVRRGEAVWTEPQLREIEQLCDLGDAPFWQPSPLQTR